MRKKLSIFVFLFTTISLLASILIPHHHHHDGICFIRLHSYAACTSHDHSDGGSKHDAEDSGDHHSCLLDLEVILPDHDKSNIANHAIQNKHFNPDQFYAIVRIQEPEQLFELWSNKKLSPLLSRQNSYCINGYPGLRAPPIC